MPAAVASDAAVDPDPDPDPAGVAVPASPPLVRRWRAPLYCAAWFLSILAGYVVLWAPLLPLLLLHRRLYVRATDALATIWEAFNVVSEKKAAVGAGVAVRHVAVAVVAAAVVVVVGCLCHFIREFLLTLPTPLLFPSP